MKWGLGNLNAPCIVHVCPDACGREADLVSSRHSAREDADDVIAGRVARDVSQDERVLLGLDDGAHRVVVVQVHDLGLVQRTAHKVPVFRNGQNLRRPQKGLEWNTLRGSQVRLEVVLRIQAAALRKHAGEELLEIFLDFRDWLW